MADNVIVRVPEQQFIRGEDGYSPEVTIEDITHGHRVTITDEDHPTGQSFNVMDGDSAYEQAVAGGYEGTETQFNEDLANFKFLSYAATSAASEANTSAQSANRSELRARSSERAAEDAAAAALIRMNSAATSAQAAEDASSFFTSTILPNAVNTINSTRDQAVADVNVAKSTAVQNVQTEGATQITAVQTESATQQAAVQQKGDDVLESIPSDYTELSEDVDGLEQTTTATTIGPVALASFNASAADMPLKGLTANIEPVQSGSGDPSPDNVRPITGRTGCELFYLGLDIKKDLAIVKNKYISTAGVETDSTTSDNSHTDYFPVTPRTTLYFSAYWDEIPDTAPAIAFYNANKVFVSPRKNFLSAHQSKGVVGYNFATLTVPDNCYYAILNFSYRVRNRIVLTKKNPTIVFPTEAGTVYGGTVDAVNGKLKAAPYYASYNGEALVGPWISSMDVYAQGATPTLGAQVVDMGGAVTSYDLSDVPEITTLFGENTIWADCGDVTVTYGAYLDAVKAYADKVGDSILSAIAPLETTYTAGQNYTVGSFLVVGAKFYKVTAAIAEGGSITPGTNVTQTTVAEQLMSLTLHIATQPQNKTAAAGTTVEFVVEAGGGRAPYTYKWYYRNPNSTGDDFAVSSNTTAAYSLKASATSHTQGYYVYCVVTDANGASVTSRTAEFTLSS